MSIASKLQVISYKYVANIQRFDKNPAKGWVSRFRYLLVTPGKVAKPQAGWQSYCYRSILDSAPGKGWRAKSPKRV